MHSLAEEIKTFSKASLRKQCTHVTTLTGKRLLETWKDSALRVEEEEEEEGACGYVQDFSLDLQVGQVRPHVLLASQDAAQDLDTLRKLKVSHILNVAYGVENSFPHLFEYKTLNILDLPETPITSYFRECSQFIDEAKAKDGVVLVHCNAGVSRSAAVVIGYLMSREGLTFDDAFALVKAARLAVRPNPGFYQQLKAYRPQEMERDHARDVNLEEH
ncbi:dual specificity protein phosphatase 19 [Scleropages formosus]|uniref:Dual specificity phosphatase 19b n=1 Tax=Scleropages formosus TaxID=113540 RepID=A0A8C9TRP4_SCLFO|nr:dual specificity protein phosphatase 19 [Scleropages formosus]